MLEWVAISSSSGPRFVRTLHYDLSWVALNSVIHSFIESCQPLRHDKAVIHEGEKVEAVTDFIFLGSKVTEHSDCSHETQRCLLFRRKAMTDLDSLFKSRDVTLPTEVLWFFQESCTNVRVGL